MAPGGFGAANESIEKDGGAMAVNVHAALKPAGYAGGYFFTLQSSKKGLHRGGVTII